MKREENGAQRLTVEAPNSKRHLPHTIKNRSKYEGLKKPFCAGPTRTQCYEFKSEYGLCRCLLARRFVHQNELGRRCTGWRALPFFRCKRKSGSRRAQTTSQVL